MADTQDPRKRPQSDREIRAALRAELESRSLDVASDTTGLKSDLYIVGDNDRAKMLFEFKSSVDEACRTMYQGNWAETMPGRVAVMPESESNSVDLELLEQARIQFLFYRRDGEAIAFSGLDDLLARLA